MTAAVQSLAALRAANVWLSLTAIALVGLTWATQILDPRTGGWMLLGTFLVGGLAAWGAARLGEQAGDQRTALVIILAGAVGMRLALLFYEPYLSTDIYRYIWDGRVQAAGINPYRYVPRAPELAQLRDTVIFPNINRPSYAVTIYPPGAQAIFFAVTRLAESVTALKLALLAFEAGTIAAILALLERQGVPPTRIALYAWHPLPVWEIAGAGHVDAAMIALVTGGLLLFVRGRTLLAGATVTLGALVKPTALLALPVFWRPWDWRLPLAVAGIAVLAYLPYLSVGSGVLGFLPGYIEEEGLVSGSGFKLLWLLEQVTGPIPGGSTIYIAISALVLASLAIAAGFRSDRSEPASLRALSWLLVTFLVLLSPHYPWYFLVLVPFLALHSTVTAWVLTTTSVLFYYLEPSRLLPTYEVRIAIFSLMMLAALAWDLRAELRRPGAIPIGETS
ncbi:MAG TPA: glycosyltransferase family 87 protein [Hyphomicrobiaceae bacterium]|nr:glycosyltransferase family 87 protein [Hyphomicrobiaceae bacterium]